MEASVNPSHRRLRPEKWEASPDRAGSSHALADGMEISLTDHEIRTVLARLEDIPEDQRTESGISSAAAMEIISNVSENRQVTVPAELLASLIQIAEQALWKREWAARDHGLAVPECVTRRQTVVNQARTLLKNNTHESD